MTAHDLLENSRFDTLIRCQFDSNARTRTTTNICNMISNFKAEQQFQFNYQAELAKSPSDMECTQIQQSLLAQMQQVSAIAFTRGIRSLNRTRILIRQALDALAHFSQIVTRLSNVLDAAIAQHEQSLRPRSVGALKRV